MEWFPIILEEILNRWCTKQLTQVYAGCPPDCAMTAGRVVPGPCLWPWMTWILHRQTNGLDQELETKAKKKKKNEVGGYLGSRELSEVKFWWHLGFGCSWTPRAGNGSLQAKLFDSLWLMIPLCGILWRTSKAVQV